MSPIDLIGAFLGFGEEVFKYLNLEAGRKYIEKAKSLRDDIVSEEAKGYDADDSKIESMWKELASVQEAMKDEIVRAAATKT